MTECTWCIFLTPASKPKSFAGFWFRQKSSRAITYFSQPLPTCNVLLYLLPFSHEWMPTFNSSPRTKRAGKRGRRPRRDWSAKFAGVSPICGNTSCTKNLFTQISVSQILNVWLNNTCEIKSRNTSEVETEELIVFPSQFYLIRVKTHLRLGYAPSRWPC